MSTTTIPVYGSTIEWSDDGVTFAAIPNCKSVVIPEVAKDFREVTNLDSPNGFREYVPSLKDGGELTLEAYYSKELYAAAAIKDSAGTLVTFRVTLPADTDQSTGDTFTFAGYITPSLPSGDIEGDLMLNIVIRTSGGVSWAQGAA
jgi:hypothetical protein